MIKSLTCPTCRQQFRNVAIEDGAVRCPHCKEIVFQYRFPGDETLTPKEFMGLLDTRGIEAARQARRFFGAGKMAGVSAGMFIPYVWTFLAQTFVTEGTDGNSATH